MGRLLKRECMMALSAVIALSGCAAVDHFEPRALQFNQEAANTKSNTILLNIVRAAYRLPFQFTEYTTTVGQTFASGQVAATLPVATVPANLAKTFSLNPQLQSNAQNQVTVQNLNSQEFYFGLQTPLTLQMLASFIAIGYDPDLVLMLAVSSLRRTSGVTIYELENDSGDWQKINQFYDVINLLLLAGLSFETQQGVARGVGPELSASEAKALLPHYIKASATAAAASGSTNALPELTQRAGDRYQLIRSKSSFRICFRKDKLDEANRKYSALLNVTRVGTDQYTLHLKLSRQGPVPPFDMSIFPSGLCGAKPGPNSPKHDSPLINWNFEMRSIEAIYHYLGKIVRTEWSDPATFENTYQFPRVEGKNFFLFKLYPGSAPGAVITANLGPGHYSILPVTPYDQDKSTQAISLLTDLWALESSAKSFPATSTISVTTQ
jgi:hypothetical protein